MSADIMEVAQGDDDRDNYVEVGALEAEVYASSGTKLDDVEIIGDIDEWGSPITPRDIGGVMIRSAELAQTGRPLPDYRAAAGTRLIFQKLNLIPDASGGWTLGRVDRSAAEGAGVTRFAPRQIL
jgi:hypothetical protein